MASEDSKPKSESGRSEGSSGLLLTLDRGIQVLEQIARNRGRATAKSLTADLGINLGTCYQLLRTLQAHGYVHRLQGGRYGLGTRIGFLADHYSSSVAPAPELIELLHGLHDRLGETVYLTVAHDGELPIVGVLEGTGMLRVGNLAVGHSGPVHVSPAARAFLAVADDATVDDFIGTATFESFTKRTRMSRRGLRDEITATRARGYGVERDEMAYGVGGIAAVIVDEDGRPYGAFASALPVQRLDAEQRELSAALLGAGEQASRFLGYAGAYPPKP